jgi:iron(III) transport system ATP-binding protein
VAAITPGAVHADGLAATVMRSQFRGDGHLATVSLAGADKVELQVLSRIKLRPGESVGLAIDFSQVRWFENSSHSPQ